MDPLVIRSSFGKILLKIKMTMRMVPMELDNLCPHTFKKSHKMTRVKTRKQTLTILPLVQLIDMRTVTFCKYSGLGNKRNWKGMLLDGPSRQFT